MKYYALIIFTLFAYSVNAQTVNAVVFHIHSSHTSFPDTGRANGYTYHKKKYNAASHYLDSSVLIVSPPRLDGKHKIDLVYWFHGWNTNIDDAALKYELIEQFISSKVNAVLILPETAKDAPDSHGGKLENEGTFKELTNDVLQALAAKHLVAKNCKPRHIILAGHSGASRVIAGILKNGGLPINETILFDAPGNTGQFIDWINTDNAHRFTHWYTSNNGGTEKETRAMGQILDQDAVKYLKVEEADVDVDKMRINRVIFVHSPREHDEIINNPDIFKILLRITPLLEKLIN